MQKNFLKRFIVSGMIVLSAFSAKASLAQTDSYSLFNYQYEQYISELTRIINYLQLEQDTAYEIAKQVVADDCVSFMDQRQFLGANGNTIFNLLSQQPKSFPNLLKGGDLQRYCPKYDGMTLKQKSLVWVMLMTMVAHFESSCKISVAAKGPNGTAKGYYQLHEGKEKNYTKSLTACPVNASRSAHQSSVCALTMLDEQLVRSNGKLFYAKSYWDVLRPQGSSKRVRQITKALTRSSLCNPRTI